VGLVGFEVVVGELEELVKVVWVRPEFVVVLLVLIPVVADDPAKVVWVRPEFVVVLLILIPAVADNPAKVVFDPPEPTAVLLPSLSTRSSKIPPVLPVSSL